MKFIKIIFDFSWLEMKMGGRKTLSLHLSRRG